MREKLTHQILKTIPLFKDSDEAHLKFVADQARFLEFKKDAFVYHRGDPCKGFYTVVYGSLKMSFTSAEGKEHVVRIAGPGQSFGEAAMFLERPFPATVQTISPARVLFIPKKVVFQCIDDDPRYAYIMLAGLSRRVHLMAARLESLALSSSQQRVIGYLLQQMNFGHGNKDIDLPANKATIASHLNLAPETFSRALQQLCETGLISLEGKIIHILDEKRLMDLNI